MKKKKEEDRYCSLFFFMKNKCYRCKIAGKCEEYERLRAKGVTAKEAKEIIRSE